MPYIATKALLDGSSQYDPGDVIPGVENWPTFRSLKSLGWIEFVDRSQGSGADGAGLSADPAPGAADESNGAGQTEADAGHTAEAKSAKTKHAPRPRRTTKPKGAKASA